MGYIFLMPLLVHKVRSDHSAKVIVLWTFCSQNLGYHESSLELPTGNVWEHKKVKVFKVLFQKKKKCFENTLKFWRSGTFISFAILYFFSNVFQTYISSRTYARFVHITLFFNDNLYNWGIKSFSTRTKPASGTLTTRFLIRIKHKILL